MPNTKKTTKRKPKRTEAQIKADEKYSEQNRANARERYKKENFKNIGATLKKPEAEEAATLYKSNGLTVAEVIKATAQRLKNKTETAQDIKKTAKIWTHEHEAEATPKNF